MRFSKGLRLTSALLAAAMLAACSGAAGTNGGSVTPMAPAAHKKFAWHGAKGFLRIRVAVPSKKQQQHIARLVATAKLPAGKAKPQFIPSWVSSICFSLIAVNGNSTSDDGACDGSNPFDFSIATSGGNCTLTSGNLGVGDVCSITAPAPAASDTWTIVATDASISQTISESHVTISVPPNGTATGNFSLNPIATGLKWFPYHLGWTNGPNPPTYDPVAQTYSCSNGGGCYDPLLNSSGTATSDVVRLNVLDPNGGAIIPSVSIAGTSGSPNIPIYLDPSGAERDVFVLCNDPDVEWLQVTTQPYAGLVANAGSSFLSGTLNSFLANGSQNAAGTNYHWVGNGNPDGQYSTFNSPANGLDGTSGGGTDFNGFAIGDSIYGNNGDYINYDGGGNGGGPYGATPVTCVAHFGSGSAATATYYIGLAEGGVTWGSNLRHHHSTIRKKA
ncbi:MAG: hypothetical protein JO199_11005 [Candidatus Eremiobacteraeota bacterium]|nr:hypothetical protein [Candidatus Eremiobacteraeota bacterium]